MYYKVLCVIKVLKKSYEYSTKFCTQQEKGNILDYMVYHHGALPRP